MSRPYRPCRPVGSRARFLDPVAAGGIVMRVLRVDGGSRVPSHGHGAAFASLALAGHCVEDYRGRTRVLASGAAVFNSPGQEHRVRVGDAGFRAFEVVFDRAFWAATGLRRPPADAGDAELAGAAWLLRRLFTEYVDLDADSPLAVASLVAELAGLLTNGGRPTDARAPWLSGVIEALSCEAPRSIGLTELARSHGVHPSHLARTFRARFGCTVGEYVRSRRVAHACRALAESDVALGRLAVRLGFSDQAHFCRVFKRITGTTPGRFRRFARSS